MPGKVGPESWVPRGNLTLESAADEAVRSVNNTAVIAGPGSGKTELLAQRACYLLQTGLCPYPQRILAVSFKRDAARNLQKRVTERCGEELARRFYSMTFDAFSKSLVDRFRRALPSEWQPRSDYRIDFKLDKRRYRDRLSAIPVAQGGLTQAQLAAVSESDYNQWFIGLRLADLPAHAPTVERRAALALWRHELHDGEQSVVNFQMLGRMAECILATNPRILLALRATYRFVFLDEFQDTTNVQYDLATTAFRGSNAVLTAVGDNKQAIMRFALAVTGIFGRFEQDFGARVLRLRNNHRSARRIVEVIGHLAQAMDHEAVVPISMDDVEADDGECRVLIFRDQDSEASHLAELIQGWVHDDGVDPREICVLTRQQPALYAASLQEALAEGGERAVAARIEDKFQDVLSEPVTVILLSLLKLGCRKRAPDAWSEVMNFLIAVRGSQTSRDVKATANALKLFVDALGEKMESTVADEDGIEALIDHLLRFVNPTSLALLYPQYSQGTFLDEQVSLLASMLLEYRTRHEWDSAIDKLEGVDALPIMTTHKSKGLEFHTVIFLGLEDNAFWSFASQSEDETGIFFVALSRAEQRVLFTFSQRRESREGYGQRTQGRTSIRTLYQLLEDAGVAPEEIA